MITFKIIQEFVIQPILSYDFDQHNKYILLDGCQRHKMCFNCFLIGNKQTNKHNNDNIKTHLRHLRSRMTSRHDPPKATMTEDFYILVAINFVFYWPWKIDIFSLEFFIWQDVIVTVEHHCLVLLSCSQNRMTCLLHVTVLNCQLVYLFIVCLVVRSPVVLLKGVIHEIRKCLSCKVPECNSYPNSRNCRNKLFRCHFNR